ncbi:hypothetical protein ABIB82_007071 [Bradyrhizobium sp. i1.8.4]|uniref:hypothetical protein n=1 Tax=unclassified Bradyrhizobium TaxID=2631580 RepID=UPI003D254617
MNQRSSVAASAMKMTATLLRRYRRKVVATAATIFARRRHHWPAEKSLNFIAPEHAAGSLQIAH